MPTTTINHKPMVRLSFAVAVLTIVCMPVHSDEQLEDTLRSCRVIADNEARLACYDDVVDQSGPAAGSPSPHETETAATSYVELNDDVGSETLNRADDERRKEIITGTVVECRQDALNDTYFYFDNGQVWKQTSDSRIKLSDCNFDVTIAKDFFGYKMQVVGEARRIRISRIR